MATTNFVLREQARRDELRELYDRFAPEREKWQARNRAYYRNIERLVRFTVPQGASVLEIGSGLGDLLAALEPADGMGIDRSPRLVEMARARHPGLRFAVGDAETLDAPELEGRTFDYVVISDTVGALTDIWSAFRSLRRVCHAGTRVMVTYYNALWEGVLRTGQVLGMKMPIPPQNWLGMQDLVNLLELNHFEVIRKGTAQLLPVGIPVLAPLVNRYLTPLPGVRHLALTQFIVARLADGGAPVRAQELSCSVIVPCKNEEGNIDDIVARTPEMGSGTEIIFVDGNSTDGTVAAIERHLQAQTRPRMRLIHQGDGRGKGDAVRKGFAAATGDVLFILDADLTVAPEDLPKFYAAIAEGRGEFINGSRLAYPMEGEAMRFLNMIGNKAFGIALSGILQQRLKDTLCGTKVLLRKDYEKIARARPFFGEFDPFCDFDLIFGAAKQNLRIVELPVRYRARTYGETKISRWRNGVTLLRMTLLAARKFLTAY